MLQIAWKEGASWRSLPALSYSTSRPRPWLWTTTAAWASTIPRPRAHWASRWTPSSGATSRRWPPRLRRLPPWRRSCARRGAAALFFADITDALAEERRAAEAQRFAEVGQIASAMAHELKSPLATVELYANLLRRAVADQPAAGDSVSYTHLTLPTIY